jgi:hypothetical protein
MHEKLREIMVHLVFTWQGPSEYLSPHDYLYMAYPVLIIYTMSYIMMV